MITVDKLPRDINSIVQGAWRLVHVDPNFNGELGAVRLVDGVATSPISGRQLKCVVAEYGGKLFIEPWGDLPPGFTLPEGVKATVSEADLAGLDLAPWRGHVADKILSLEEEIARALADGRDVPAFDEVRADIADLPLEGLHDAWQAMLDGAAMAREGFPAIAAEIEKLATLCEERTAMLTAERSQLANEEPVVKAGRYAAEMRAHPLPLYAAGCARQQADGFRLAGSEEAAVVMDAVAAELEAPAPKLNPQAPETPYAGAEAAPGVVIPASETVLLDPAELARAPLGTVTRIDGKPLDTPPDEIAPPVAAKPAPAEKPKGKPKAK